MEGRSIIDDGLGVGSVGVESNSIELGGPAVSTDLRKNIWTHVTTSASREELRVPVEASLRIGTSRRDQLVAFVLERIDVCLPEINTIGRAHVRLARFIRPERTISV